MECNINKNKRLNVAIFGNGVVGNGVYELLSKDQNILIKKIVVKDKNKKRVIPNHLISYDKNDILEDHEIDVIVELIDDAEAALDIIKIALSKGKKVVSANKRMISKYADELLPVLSGNFLYESAVCGSIPIIRNIDTFYSNDKTLEFEGIFNGSTNFILTKLFESQTTVDEVIHTAKDLGYLESDPSLDLEGYDTLSKLQILNLHFFGKSTNGIKIPRLGIERINDFDIDYAKKRSLNIKLVAFSKADDKGIISFVLPKFIPRNNIFHSVQNENNIISINSLNSGVHTLIGKGAGKYPTSMSIIHDIELIKEGYSYRYKSFQKNDNTSLPNFTLKIYVRINNSQSETFYKFFDKIIENEYDNDNLVIIGIVSNKNLLKIINEQGNSASVILMNI